MFLKLFALFTLLPLIELYLLFKISGYIGAFNTVFLVFATGALGAWLARSQGFAAWFRIQQEMNQGLFPAESLLDGLLILFAGAVLITPGVITDIAGFLILIPPVRSLIREWVKKRLRYMSETGSVTISGFIR